MKIVTIKKDIPYSELGVNILRGKKVKFIKKEKDGICVVNYQDEIYYVNNSDIENFEKI